MKTIFAVQDPELGWVGFQTAEEAGKEAIKINCYETLAELNDAKLERVRQGALAKLMSHKIAQETNELDDFKKAMKGLAWANRGSAAIKLSVVVAGSVVVLVLLGIMAISSGWGVVNFQSVFQKIRAFIPIAARPPAPSVTTSPDPQAAREFPQLGQSGEPKGAPPPYLKPSASAPRPAPLPEDFGRMEVDEPFSPGESPALSPPGQSEIKPESAGEPKLAAEIATKKEEQEKAKGPLPELGGTPPPSPGPAPAQIPPAARQLIAQAGEGLTRIANRSYPANNKLGFAALILANPEIENEDKIFPGQALYLPEINFPKETIRLKDHRFYAVYGLYQSAESLRKDTTWLEKKQVHFVIRDTKGTRGMLVHRVLLGGYETEEELAEALKSVNLKSP
jgi:hypothetical protein